MRQVKLHKIELSFMLVSAKTGQNINNAFQTLARRILLKRQVTLDDGDNREGDPNSGSDNSKSAENKLMASDRILDTSQN